MAKWKNVHRFSNDVPETVHDGHQIGILSTFIPDISEPDIEMCNVFCYDCMIDFQAFEDEVISE